MITENLNLILTSNKHYNTIENFPQMNVYTQKYRIVRSECIVENNSMKIFVDKNQAKDCVETPTVGCRCEAIFYWSRRRGNPPPSPIECPLLAHFFKQRVYYLKHTR